ncbi:MAG: hypothetical protein ACOYVD_07795 [Bacillota bacterium]
MDKIKKYIQIDNENYQVLSQVIENEHVIYRNFMVSKEGLPVLLYDLGVTKVALIIYNENKFDPSKWLLDLGVQFIQDMLSSGNYSHKSGIITSLEMSKNEYDWRKLEHFKKDEVYTR